MRRNWGSSRSSFAISRNGRRRTSSGSSSCSKAGMDEQERRFKARIDDPLRQWKLSPMDTASYRRWYDYSEARDLMLKATSTQPSPWYIIRSDDKRRARLNCIAHLLKLIPHKRM